MGLFDFLGAGGHVLGAGGGLLAGEMYRRFHSASKDAKDAKKLVEALVKRVEVDMLPKLQSYATKGDLGRLQEHLEKSIARVARGSRSPDLIGSDPAVLGRLTEIERRMSSIEDAFDEAQKEDRKWAEAIREKLGRIEGWMNPPRND